MSNDLQTVLAQVARSKAAQEQWERDEIKRMVNAQKSGTPTSFRTMPQHIFDVGFDTENGAQADREMQKARPKRSKVVAADNQMHRVSNGGSNKLADDASKKQAVSMGVSATPSANAKVAILGDLKRKRVEHVAEGAIAASENGNETSPTAARKRKKVEDNGGERSEARNRKNVVVSADKMAKLVSNMNDEIATPRYKEVVTMGALTPAVPTAPTSSTTISKSAPKHLPVSYGDPVEDVNPRADISTPHASLPAPISIQPAEIGDIAPLQGLIPGVRELGAVESSSNISGDVKTPVVSFMDSARLAGDSIVQAPRNLNGPAESAVEELHEVQALPESAIVGYLKKQLRDLRKANADLIREQNDLIRSTSVALAQAKMSKQAEKTLRQELQRAELEKANLVDELQRVSEEGDRDRVGARDVREFFDEYGYDREAIEAFMAIKALKMEPFYVPLDVDVRSKGWKAGAECHRAQLLDATHAKELIMHWRKRALDAKLEVCNADRHRARFLGNLNLHLNTIFGLLQHSNLSCEDLLEPLVATAEAIRDAVVMETIIDQHPKGTRFLTTLQRVDPSAATNRSTIWSNVNPRGSG